MGASTAAEERRRLEQRCLASAVRTVRDWYLTLCHDLCIRPPRVAVLPPALSAQYGVPEAGTYEPDAHRVTIRFLVHPDARHVDEEHLRSLAHELRHAFQYQNAATHAVEERDAEAYERDVLRRFAAGPEAARWDGAIEGVPPRGTDVEHRATVSAAQAAAGVLIPLSLNHGGGDALLVDVRVPAGTTHGAKLRVRGMGQPSPAGDGDLIVVVQVSEELARAAHARDVARAKSAAGAGGVVRSVAARLASALRRGTPGPTPAHVDRHPDDGKLGYWRVEGTYCVRASSAAEAVMKVAHKLDGIPKRVEFVGDRI